jgi:DNA-binding NtrC family response regulator
MNRREDATILIVDDEEAVLNGVRRTLQAEGFDSVLMCRDARDVAGLLDAERVSLVLLDMMMPHIGGREVLEHITSNHPEIPVVMVTAQQDIRTAVDCMKSGAYDYLLKPAGAAELLSVVTRALEHRELREERASRAVRVDHHGRRRDAAPVRIHGSRRRRCESRAGQR